MTNLFQYLAVADQAMQFFRHQRDAWLAPPPGLHGRSKEGKQEERNTISQWSGQQPPSVRAFYRYAASLSLARCRQYWQCGRWGALEWVAGVEPVASVEEEGVNGGSAGGAFAWREAEGSGKEGAVVQACCQED